MTIQEFYTNADGDYNEVLEALGKETRILKYLLKFPGTQASKVIRAALDAGDYETAFREAHNLKGMSLNMGLTKLGELSSDLTESLRNGPTKDVDALWALVDTEYQKICELISQIN